MCRLLITIEDTGCGMELDSINDILSNDDKIEKEEIEKVNDLDVDLKITKKIIKLLGGVLLIKSEVNKGSTFTIVLDQKIYKEENDNDIFSSYINKMSNKKRILLVDDKYEELKNISKYIENKDIEVVTSMYGNDAIERIENKELYDLIIMDDEMKPLNAIETYRELKKISKFKIKTIIMIDKNKDFIKEHYIKDYKFKDYILKEDLKSEIDRIIDEYL